MKKNKYIFFFFIILLHISISANIIVKQSSNKTFIHINMKDEYLSMENNFYVRHIFVNIPEGKYSISINKNGYFEYSDVQNIENRNFQYETEEVYLGLQKVLDIKLYPLFEKNNKIFCIENYDIEIIFENTLNYSQAINKFSVNKNYMYKTVFEKTNIPMKNYLQIRIDSTGIYKVTYEDIKKSGLSPENINPNKMVLYMPDSIRYIENDIDFNFSPIEIPYKFIGDNDNVFEKGEYFLFFGQSVWGKNKNIYNLSNENIDMYNNPFSDYNVYIMAFNKNKTKRFFPVEYTFKNGVDSVYTSKTFIFDSINVLKKGYCWVWKDYKFSDNDNDKEFNYIFNIDNLCSSNAQIIMSMFFGIRQTYNMELYLNDSLVSELTYSGISYREPIEFDNIINNLSENNNLKLIIKSNNTSKRMQIRGFSINYSAKLNNIKSQLSFYSDTIIHYTNTSKDNIYIYYKKNENEFFDINKNKEFNINTKNSFVYINNKVFSPISVNYIDINNILNKKNADIIVITGNNMSKPLIRYKKYRESQGMSTEIFEINEIYNAFSYGFESPYAIKLFLKYAMYNWDKKPTYVFIVGNGTYDYKNRMNNYKTRNIVPIFETGYISSYEGFITPDVSNVSDEWFAWLIGDDHIPDIIPGRVTVLDNKETDNVIQKIIDYETKHSTVSQNKCLLIADDEYSSRVSHDFSDISFINQIQELSLRLSGMYVSDYIYVSDYWGDKQTSEHWDSDPGEKRQVRFVISDKLNEDFGFFFFLGHGADYTMTHEHILKYPEDINLFTNTYKYPIALFGTCSAGEFDGDNDCIASAFQKLRTSGFSASIASARATVITSNFDLLANCFVYYMKEGSFSTIGDYYNRIMMENSGESYILFGDPAMIIKKRFLDIDINVNDTVYYGSMDSIVFNTENIKNRNLYINVYQTTYMDSHDYTHIEPYTYVYYPKYDGMFLNTQQFIKNNFLKLNMVFPDTMENKKYINRYIISAIAEDDTSYHIAYDNYNYIFYNNTNNTQDSMFCNLKVYYNNFEIEDSIFLDTNYTLKILVKSISGIYAGNKEQYKSYLQLNDSIIYIKNFVFNENDSTYYKEINIESSYKEDTIRIIVFNNELNKTEKNFVVKHTALSNSMESIIVYPNPFRDDIYISFISSRSGKMSAYLLNSLGGVLNKQEYLFYPGQNIFKMNLKESLLKREIVPGIYKLKIDYKYSNYRTNKVIYKTLIKVK